MQDMSDKFGSFLIASLELFVAAIMLALGLVALWVIVAYIVDVTETLQCNRNTCSTGITTHDAKLQRGLHPPEKAERVAAYVRNMVKEVGIIAHACGVRSPRELHRGHARVVQDNGLCIGLDQLHPIPERRSDGCAAGQAGG